MNEMLQGTTHQSIPKAVFIILLQSTKHWNNWRKCMVENIAFVLSTFISWIVFGDSLYLCYSQLYAVVGKSIQSSLIFTWCGQHLWGLWHLFGPEPLPFISSAVPPFCAFPLCFCFHCRLHYATWFFNLAVSSLLCILSSHCLLNPQLSLGQEM